MNEGKQHFYPESALESERAKEVPETVRRSLEQYLEAARINEQKAETPEERKLEQLYISEFLLPMNELLTKTFKDKNGNDLCIADELNRGIERYRATASVDQNNASRAFVETLMESFSRFSVNDWCISPKVALETGGLNCLTASAAAFVLLDSVKERAALQRVDYVNPYGHAALVVTLQDGSVWYADPRNNVLADLSGHVAVTDSQHLRTYFAEKPIAHTAYQALPALLPARYAIMDNHLSLASKVLSEARGEVGEFTQLTRPTQEGRDASVARAQSVEKGIDYTEETMPELMRCVSTVNGPLIDFYQTPEFKADKQRFHDAKNEEAELHHIGDLVKNNDALRRDVIQNKLQLKDFLLQRTETVGFDNPALEAAFARYRDVKVQRKNSLGVSDDQFAAEVENLIERIN